MSDLSLKPCPFCGVDGSIEEARGTFMAICMSCYCNVGENYDGHAVADHMFKTAEEAAEAWNTRALPASPVHPQGS